VVLPNAPTLIALNKWNGKLLAKDDSRISPNVFHGQWSSPTLGLVGGHQQFFYGGGDGICYGFKPLDQGVASSPTTLQELWRFDANPVGYRQREGKPIDYWKLVHAAKEGFARTGRSSARARSLAPCFGNRVYVTIGQDPA
jgi:hypothetical protein